MNGQPHLLGYRVLAEWGSCAVAKILLVEDNEEYARLISSYLVDQKYLVEVACSGEDALHRLKTSKYDVVILDWELGDLSGVSVCKQYRFDKGTAPVLMLTARGLVDEKAEGLDAGADDYLVKPVNPLELAARLRALLRRPQGINAGDIQINDYCLHQSRRQLTLGGKQVPLLPREYALVEFLMRHKGAVFSADELLDRVWPSEVGVSVESLRSCVARVKRRLEAEGGGQLIRNIYGTGYTIDDPENG